ncbi:aspartate-semialdehyde dehydrogenase [Salinicoccus sp. ID82-1]|uniref:aspartate-semialdehyde dehydrogenase n=1 Tax=Salinicoccus sp. ID82-1 TaxID=2820269 RepID=UPI001F010966|nr:aspartate-semialdehyde dehydrogenase [Salinicoccus sp. ID82-1]MCG1009158.1 aspartate-semialdehyde dehydrogenase [Salinicoccus sp. ID82-1]
MVKVAIVGATGVVGNKMIEMFEQYEIEADELVLFSSPRSAGKEIEVLGRTLTVRELNEESAKEPFDYVVMSAGGGTSKEFAPIFEENGAIVIDNSSQWRMHEDIDLIVPEINTPKLERGIIANPNCSTIQSVVALQPLKEKYGLKRVHYTTYQAVSGSGSGGLRDLEAGAKGEAPTTYPHPIYDNVLPHIDVFMADGYTKEEIKMMDETKKILDQPDLRVTATCVRVPVSNSHSVHINVTLDQEATVEEVREAFRDIPYIKLLDDPANNVYPTPLESTGEQEVSVGRIRRDDSLENTFHIWCTADNLLKGAAQNTVQILKMMMETERVQNG